MGETRRESVEIDKLAHALGVSAGPEKVRVPKYLRLSDGIMQAIEVGELCSGERLPGESELAEVLPFSLGTVQKALSHLAERGAVVRRHGSGTFVADSPTQLNELWHFRFLAPDGKSLLPVFTQVTNVAKVATGGPWTAFLSEEEFHIRIDRDIDVNHEFRAVSRVYLPGARFAKLLDDRAAKVDNLNIRTLLRERFDAPTLRVVEQVGAETMPDDVTDDLELDQGINGLVLHIQGFGFRDTPLSYQVVYVPPNARKLEVQPKLL